MKDFVREFTYFILMFLACLIAIPFVVWSKITNEN